MDDRRKRVADAGAAIRKKHKIRLEGAGTDAVTAWFLGPKGENGGLMQRLVRKALQSHLSFRKHVYPEDPPFITPKMRASVGHQRSVERLVRDFDHVLDALQESGAFFSMRSQGHMLWDVTIPGLAGYFAAMLYNQNNVASEASPVTTMMEIAVGDDLCQMLGFSIPPTSTEASEAPVRPPVRPWGHITCDGSVANMEGLWMARSLKFYPPALLAAAREVREAAPIAELRVPLLDGSEKPLSQCDAWQLLNLPIDAVLALPTLVEEKTGIGPERLAALMKKYTVSALGMAEACQKYIFSQGLTRPPVFTAPATNHYSWPKGAALLGIGTNQIWDVQVDLAARQEVDFAKERGRGSRALRARLEEALETKTPVLTVVAVMGSTEESAVDPLHEIVALREEFRREGLEFTIHADAAWGGYFASTLPPAKPRPRRRQPGGLLQTPLLSANLVLKAIPRTPMSADIIRRYVALRDADSITVDPHKAGYIPYPAGGLCYRDSNMRNLVSLKSPVVFHGDADPTVGVFGVEGSKPGAAAAAIYMSHKAIRPTPAGYGKVLEQCIFSSKKLYCRLRTMARADDPFCIAFVQRLPAETEGRSSEAIRQQLRDVRTWFVGKSNAQIVKGGHYDFFKQLGSDQTILSWAVNFKNRDGTWNQSIDKLNQLNDALYLTFSMMPTPTPKGGNKLKKPSDVKLIITGSSFDVAAYGAEFLRTFLGRLELQVDPGRLSAPEFPAVKFNVSTQMDPWFTEDANNPQDGFLAQIETIIRSEILRQVAVLTQ